MRDHTKLKAFELADALVLNVYRVTNAFPRHEQFGLTNQIRRAAVSVPSNIVEGCSRSSQAEYVRFLDIAYGSARELAYQLNLATRLSYLNAPTGKEIEASATEVCKVLNGLIRSLRKRNSSVI